MQTRIFKLSQHNPDEAALKEVAHILRKGGLAVVPTETVYGIAANMQDPQALSKLDQIKNRPQGKKYSLHIADKGRLKDFACDISPAAYRLIDAFWPGPLTVVLRSRGEGSIGIRMPDHEIASALIRLAAIPIVCPSANISGEDAPKDFGQAIQALGGKVEAAIDAGPCSVGLESTVVDLTGGHPRVLREGAIKKEEIERAASLKVVLFVCTGNSCRSVMAEALLEKIMRQKNRTDVQVHSAGLMALTGLAASEGTKEVLKRQGIDASAHVSQKVTAEMIDRADLVLVMEKAHEQAVLRIAPEAKNRVFLLKEFAKIEQEDLDIRDPIGRPIDFYEKTFLVVKEAVERVSNLI